MLLVAGQSGGTNWTPVVMAVGTVLVTVVPLIVGGIIKIIQAVNEAHGTAAKALAAAEALAVEMHPPSNSVSNGAVTENTSVALHYFVDMLAAVLKVPAPVLPTPKQTQEKVQGATLDSLPITTNTPRNIPSSVFDHEGAPTSPTSSLPPFPPEAPSGSTP